MSEQLAEIKSCTPELNEHNSWMVVESDCELTSWPPEEEPDGDDDSR